MIIYEPITTLSQNVPLGTPVYNKLGNYCGIVIRHDKANMYATDTKRYMYDNWLGTYGFPKSCKCYDITEWGREVSFCIKGLICQFCPTYASYIIA